MKNEIIKIVEDLKQGTITDNEANTSHALYKKLFVSKNIDTIKLMNVGHLLRNIQEASITTTIITAKKLAL